MFSDPRLTNFIANALALVAVAVIAAALIAWLINRPYFNIARIYIEAMQEADKLEHVSPAVVKATVGTRLQGNFFTAQLDDIRKVFETVPWVRRAKIKRVWPNTLRVSLEEQQPLALWNENAMINTWGETFSANRGELPDNWQLPQFYGPDNAERLVVQRYAELAHLLAPLNLSVKAIELSPRYAWSVELSDGLRLSLGRDPGADEADPHGRGGALSFAARIAQFVEAWPKLQQQLAGRAVRSADLRYPNGFAITLAPVSTNTIE